MNIRDLKYLVAIADHLHFGKAAVASHISQPTLSMQIKKLESYLGVKFIERTNKQVMLTVEGKQIVARARNIVQESNELVRFAKSLHNPFVGEFRLGAFPTLAPYYLPKIIPALGHKFPQLRMLLIEEKTELLLQQLRAGVIDAALIALPIAEDDLVSKTVFKEPFFLAVPTGHLLAKKKKIAMQDLAQETLLLLDEGHCMRTQMLAVCARVNAKEQTNFRATSLETLRQMVIAGSGITLMPQSAITKKEKGIVYLPFTAPTPQRTIGLVWRKTTAKTELLKAMFNYLLL